MNFRIPIHAINSWSGLFYLYPPLHSFPNTHTELFESSTGHNFICEFICEENSICLKEFSVFLVLLIASLECHLTCTSVLCISSTGSSKDLIKFRVFSKNFS